MPYALLLERNRLVVFIKTRRTRNDCIVIIACRPFAGDVVEEVITWISKLGVLGDKFQADCPEGTISVLGDQDLCRVF